MVITTFFPLILTRTIIIHVSLTYYDLKVNFSISTRAINILDAFGIWCFASLSYNQANTYKLIGDDVKTPIHREWG